MDRPITTRLPEKFIKRIKEIAEKENVDVSTIIRKFLAESIKDWKIKHALNQYSHGIFSFGEAVKFAEISAWDFPDLLKKHKIHINYDDDEFERDIKFIKKWD